MNRRQILKTALLAPLLGLFKKEDSPKEVISPSAQMYRGLGKTPYIFKTPTNEMMAQTSGTSSEGPVYCEVSHFMEGDVFYEWPESLGAMKKNDRLDAELMQGGIWTQMSQNQMLE